MNLRQLLGPVCDARHIWNAPRECYQRERATCERSQQVQGAGVDSSIGGHNVEFVFSEVALALLDVIASTQIAGDDVDFTVVRLILDEFAPNLRYAAPSTKLLILAVEEYYSFVKSHQGQEFVVPTAEQVSPVTRLLVCASFLRICEDSVLASASSTDHAAQQNALVFKFVAMVKEATKGLIPQDHKMPCQNFAECFATWLQGAALLTHGRRLSHPMNDAKQQHMVKMMVLDSAKKKLIDGLSAFEDVKNRLGTSATLAIPSSIDLTLSFSPFLISAACAIRNELWECRYWLIRAAAEGKFPTAAQFAASSDMNSVRHHSWITDTENMSRFEAQHTFATLSLSAAREADEAALLSQSMISLDVSFDVPSPAAIVIPQQPVSTFAAAPGAPASSPPQYPSFPPVAAAVAAPAPPYPSVHQPAPDVSWFSKSTLDFIGDLGRSVNLNNQQANAMAAEDRHRQTRERLNQRLELFQMRETREIPGDGNCQMYSMSDQLWKSLDHHRLVRRDIVNWLRANSELELPNGAKLKDFVHGMSWDQYCDGMAKDGTWGDHLTLIAASELYAARIMIISSTVDEASFITEIVPTTQPVQRSIFLCHYAEFHYSSILPIRDTR
eukprot:TRINITY_DN2550_c0_g1_i5.p1 TRINITY_DN2550_c0_g1~~TRINITY_DN2550_c0_g1_i5.p1  ORF type:complete len:613 (+),score=123.20 TRINITY_DN2550_c0_g1_i5:1487-3325(+)